MMYKLQKDGFGQDYVTVVSDNGTKVIPFNPESPYYIAYLAWLAEGNTPEPADTQGAE